MEKNKKTERESRRYRWFKPFLLIAIPIMVIAILFAPTNYYLEMPGTTQALNTMVNVQGKKDDHKGNFFLTTVEIARANLATMAYAKLTPFTTIYSANELMGGLSNSQYDLVNQFYMQTAQNTAVYQAFKLANLPYQLKYDGVYVLSIEKNSTFKDKLQIADTVTAVDGHSFTSSKEMMTYIQSQKVGQPVAIEVTRINGKKYRFTGKYIKISTGKTGIGIGLVDHTQVVTTPKVTVNAGAIGGPSAGMMFTLEIYSQLTGKDLRQGREIAGTGTIESDGTIGQIGGIDKKIATASKEGASIFLAPDSGSKKVSENNYLGAKAAAKKLNTKMKIVPVKTIQEALNDLEK